MRVYLSGRVEGAWYRSQYIIKTLIDKGIPFSILPTHSFFPVIKYKILRKFMLIFHTLALFPVRLYFIIISTHVVILPCNWSIVTIIDISLARIFNKKVIVDFYISLYDMEVNDRQDRKKEGFVARVLFYKDRFLMSNATKLIFLNNSESIYYQKVLDLKVDKEKIEIIPLSVDPRKDSEVDLELNNNVLRVCWWGTYIPLHGLECIIKAFCLLKEEKVELYIFGNSVEKSKKHKQMIADLGICNKVFISNNKTFSNGMLESFLIRNCHLSLGNFGSSTKAKTVLTNKLIDSLSLAIPCLTMKTRATQEFFQDGDNILYCKAEPEDVANKILQLMRDKNKLKDIGVKGKKLYWKFFSPSRFSCRFEKIL